MKFFHSYLNGRSRKLHIGEIITYQGETIAKKELIGKEAIEIYGKQFRDKGYSGDYAMIQHIPKLITTNKNEEMEKLPDEEEVRQVVFAINKNSASGSDGFVGAFYQT